jgi:uncharacterized protein YqhQ
MPDQKRTFYGGQAVLEGVMMRGRKYMAVAVRAPNGRIVVRSEPLPSRIYGGLIGRTPLLRGLTMLWDSLGLGMRALMFSAEVAAQGESAELRKSVRWTSVVTTLLFGIGLFFVVPVVMGSVAEAASESWLIALVVEGLVRLLFLLGYVALIGQIPDIRRVYAYHGAEHMTIHAYEAGDPLVPERICRYPPAHPRCGTTFLLLLVVVSIGVFALVPTDDLGSRIVSRILLIPVIAGLAYEVLRFGGTHHGHPLVNLIVRPGLWLQSLTTRHPDDTQIEVAVAAFQEMFAREQAAAT